MASNKSRGSQHQTKHVLLRRHKSFGNRGGGRGKENLDGCCTRHGNLVAVAAGVIECLNVFVDVTVQLNVFYLFFLFYYLLFISLFV